MVDGNEIITPRSEGGDFSAKKLRRAIMKPPAKNAEITCIAKIGNPLSKMGHKRDER